MYRPTCGDRARGIRRPGNRLPASFRTPPAERKVDKDRNKGCLSARPEAAAEERGGAVRLYFAQETGACADLWLKISLIRFFSLILHSKPNNGVSETAEKQTKTLQ